MNHIRSTSMAVMNQKQTFARPPKPAQLNVRFASDSCQRPYAYFSAKAAVELVVRLDQQYVVQRPFIEISRTIAAFKSSKQQGDYLAGSVHTWKRPWTTLRSRACLSDSIIR